MSGKCDWVGYPAGTDFLVGLQYIVAWVCTVTSWYPSWYHLPCCPDIKLQQSINSVSAHLYFGTATCDEGAAYIIPSSYPSHSMLVTTLWQQQMGGHKMVAIWSQWSQNHHKVVLSGNRPPADRFGRKEVAASPLITSLSSNLSPIIFIACWLTSRWPVRFLVAKWSQGDGKLVTTHLEQ